MNPGPPALEASTRPLGYRGDDGNVVETLHAFSGFGVVESCVTDAKIIAVNNAVQAIGSNTDLSAILASTDLALGEKMLAIVNMTCVDPR